MQKTEKFRTVCRTSHGECGVITHVKNDRVIKVEGDPEFNNTQILLLTMFI